MAWKILGAKKQEGETSLVASQKLSVSSAPTWIDGSKRLRDDLLRSVYMRMELGLILT